MEPDGEYKAGDQGQDIRDHRERQNRHIEELSAREGIARQGIGREDTADNANRGADHDKSGSVAKVRQCVKSGPGIVHEVQRQRGHPHSDGHLLFVFEGEQEQHDDRDKGDKTQDPQDRGQEPIARDAKPASGRMSNRG